ncbi:MAG: Gfo/Idh/MocA family oxidoreductase [Kiritimatiellae bacterium]|nr:Gfo/Idh/MocA family oxidoreductase [Kiritimatiellia bacterium]
MAKAKTKRAARTKVGKPVRWAIVGVGGMGQGHCKSLQRVKDAKLTAVCDVHAGTAEQVGKQFGVAWFSDHRKLIRSGLCDAVLIATPHPFHPNVAVDCMNAKISVLTEKPLSERVSTADKMIQAGRKNRVAFAVMFQRRFEPHAAKALELVRTGQLGRLYRATLISPMYRSQAYYDSGAWRATWRGEGGGVMMNQSPHDLDLFVQLAGVPVEVFGRTETNMHHIEVEDLAMAMLKYRDGGAGYLYCSTTEPGPCGMIELFGDKGKLVLRDRKMIFYRFDTPVARHIKTNKGMWSAPKAEEVPLEIPETPSGHFRVMQNLTRHLLTGEELVTPGASGLGSLELANAVTLSSHLGKWVKLPISRRQYDAFLKEKRETSTFVKKGVKEQRTTDPGHRK